MLSVLDILSSWLGFKTSSTTLNVPNRLKIVSPGVTQICLEQASMYNGVSQWMHAVFIGFRIVIRFDEGTDPDVIYKPGDSGEKWRMIYTTPSEASVIGVGSTITYTGTYTDEGVEVFEVTSLFFQPNWARNCHRLVGA